MYYTYIVAAIAVGLFLGMLVLLEIGHRIGQHRLAVDPEGTRAGTGAVDGAVLALLGLLVAFTFSGAAGRFDARRQMVIDEANAIGTAYLRIDLLPAAEQPTIRQAFRQYLDSRIAAYRELPDVEAALREYAKAVAMQQGIWRQAVAASQGEAAQPIRMLLLPALNEMFDIATTRALTAQLHPPIIIFVMLVGLSLVSALLAGYGMASGRRRSLIHVIGFAATLSLVVFVILDLEHPRLGLIRIDDFDQAMVNVRAGMTH
jgi:hypothetical protein